MLLTFIMYTLKLHFTSSANNTPAIRVQTERRRIKMWDFLLLLTKMSATSNAWEKSCLSKQKCTSYSPCTFFSTSNVQHQPEEDKVVKALLYIKIKHLFPSLPLCKIFSDFAVLASLQAEFLYPNACTVLWCELKFDLMAWREKG